MANGQNRINTHSFIGRIKNSWVFNIIAEGFSHSFGLAAIIRLVVEINTSAMLLLQNISAHIYIKKLYLRTSAIKLILNMPKVAVLNKTKISAFMAQIIKQYQTIKFGLSRMRVLGIKLLLRSSGTIRFKTKLIGDPIVGQYTRLVQIDPNILADMDSNTLEQVDIIIP